MLSKSEIEIVLAIKRQGLTIFKIVEIINRIREIIYRVF